MRLRSLVLGTVVALSSFGCLRSPVEQNVASAEPNTRADDPSTSEALASPSTDATKTAAEPEPLRFDEDYDREYAKGQFKRADKNKDDQLSAEDGKKWKDWEPFDSNGDGRVTREELVAQADKLFAPLGATAKRNIIYKEVDGTRLQLDLFFPPNPQNERLPLLLQIHGGGWQSGSKDIGSRGGTPLFDKLLDAGIAVGSINYRKLKMWRDTDPLLMRDCVIDSHDALRFLGKYAEELRIDPNRVAVFGSSAGGHLAQMVTWSDPALFPGAPELAQYSLRPAAGVSWFGPTDFRDQDLFVVPEGVNKEYDSWHWANRVTKYDGNIYDSKDPKVLAALSEMSPLVYLTSDSAPLLQVHGSIDSVIPVKHAYRLEEKAKELGAPVRIVIAKDAWHGWGNGNSDPSPAELRELTADYIIEQLAPAR